MLFYAYPIFLSYYVASWQYSTLSRGWRPIVPIFVILPRNNSLVQRIAHLLTFKNMFAFSSRIPYI